MNAHNPEQTPRTLLMGNGDWSFLAAETAGGTAYFRIHAGRVQIEGPGLFYQFGPSGVSDTDAGRLVDALRYCKRTVADYIGPPPAGITEPTSGAFAGLAEDQTWLDE